MPMLGICRSIACCLVEVGDVPCRTHEKNMMDRRRSLMSVAMKLAPRKMSDKLSVFIPCLVAGACGEQCGGGQQ